MPSIRHVADTQQTREVIITDKAALHMELVVKNPPDNTGDVKTHGFSPWVRKSPWRRAWQPTPTFLPGESHDREAWKATVLGVARVGHDLVTNTPGK